MAKPYAALNSSGNGAEVVQPRDRARRHTRGSEPAKNRRVATPQRRPMRQASATWAGARGHPVCLTKSDGSRHQGSQGQEQQRPAMKPSLVRRLVLGLRGAIRKEECKSLRRAPPPSDAEVVHVADRHLSTGACQRTMRAATARYSTHPRRLGMRTPRRRSGGAFEEPVVKTRDLCDLVQLVGNVLNANRLADPIDAM